MSEQRTLELFEKKVRTKSKHQLMRNSDSKFSMNGGAVRLFKSAIRKESDERKEKKFIFESAIKKSVKK